MIQIPARSNADTYNNKFVFGEEPSTATLKELNNSEKAITSRSGGGSDDTMDPNDPNWGNPNTGDGTGISVLSPINNGLNIIIPLLFAYLFFLVIRKRKTANSPE